MFCHRPLAGAGSGAMHVLQGGPDSNLLAVQCTRCQDPGRGPLDLSCHDSMGASCFKWWNYVQLSRTDFNAVTCLAETCHSCLRRLIGNRFVCECGCPARQARPHARRCLRRDAATHHRRVNSKEFGDCACSRPHAPWQIHGGVAHRHSGQRRRALSACAVRICNTHGR